MAMTASRPESHELSETSVYVYGVTWADGLDLPRMSGIAGGRVDAVRHRRLAAIISPAPSGPIRTKRRELLTHMEVLQSVFASTAVLPVRFGSVFPDHEVLADELLSARHDELVGLLRRFDGLGELRVRATYEEDEILAEVVRGDRSVARLRELTRAAGHGTDPRRLQLGEAVARTLGAMRERDARAISATLLASARDAVAEAPRTAYELLRASYLVERRRLAEFDEVMDELARRERHRIAFTYTGPLPPHSFASLSARKA